MEISGIPPCQSAERTFLTFVLVTSEGRNIRKFIPGTYFKHSGREDRVHVHTGMIHRGLRQLMGMIRIHYVGSAWIKLTQSLDHRD